MTHAPQPPGMEARRAGVGGDASRAGRWAVLASAALLGVVAWAAPDAVAAPAAPAAAARAGPAATPSQNDIAAIGGDQSRQLLGTGRGVVVGVIDAGIDDAQPLLRGSFVAQADFTGTGKTGDSQPAGGHGTGVAGLYVAHGTTYAGLAPSAGLINARAVDAFGSTTDARAGNALFYAVRSGARVVNFSLGNKLPGGPITDQLNLMVDYAAEAYGASVVAAAGNENDSAVTYTPGGSFNGYSVGAVGGRGFGKVTSFSNYAQSTDLRSKPDLVAPGQAVLVAASGSSTGNDLFRASGTTYSAPMVGGVLAQMIGFGQDHGLSTSPQLLKAVLLASADKVRRNDNTDWAPRDLVAGRRGAMVADQPLDPEQGAGRVDALTAYSLYARQPTASTPLAQWQEGRLKADRSILLPLGPLKAGEHVDAALTWLRHVGRNDNGNGRPDAGDQFFASAPLARLALQLLRDGKVVYSSEDPYDNLNFVSWTLAAGGNYDLRAVRLGAAGLRWEPYALAARVNLTGAANPSLARPSLDGPSPASPFAAHPSEWLIPPDPHPGDLSGARAPVGSVLKSLGPWPAPREEPTSRGGVTPIPEPACALALAALLPAAFLPRPRR